MTERSEPYVGASGVVNQAEQRELQTNFWWAWRPDGYCADRRLALGVKAVHKTQYLDIANKYGKEWYPVGEEAFAGALDGDSLRSRNHLGVAQVCFDEELVGDAGYRREFVERICRRGKAWLNALQFDMLPWHIDEAMLPFIEEVKSTTRHTVILQAHGESMRMFSPTEMAKRLGQYATSLDYVLFDASHGKGERMNPEALRPFIEAAYESSELAGVGIGVAGGLNTQVVREDLPPLVRLYPNLSWDAEGQLHPVCVDGTRPIDMKIAKEYLEASSSVLSYDD